MAGQKFMGRRKRSSVMRQQKGKKKKTAENSGETWRAGVGVGGRGWGMENTTWIFFEL